MTHFLWSFKMFSLKCRTEYLTHALADVYFIQRWKCNSSNIYKPYALLKRAFNNSMGPTVNDRLLAQHAMLFGWLLIFLYQLSNLITIHLYSIGYKMHFHIGLSSVNELDLHYKATIWHSYLAWLTHPNKLTPISCTGFYIYRLIYIDIKWVCIDIVI